MSSWIYICTFSVELKLLLGSGEVGGNVVCMVVFAYQLAALAASLKVAHKDKTLHTQVDEALGGSSCMVKKTCELGKWTGSER